MNSTVDLVKIQVKSDENNVFRSGEVVRDRVRTPITNLQLRVAGSNLLPELTERGRINEVNISARRSRRLPGEGRVDPEQRKKAYGTEGLLFVYEVADYETTPTVTGSDI